MQMSKKELKAIYKAASDITMDKVYQSVEKAKARTPELAALLTAEYVDESEEAKQSV